MNNFGNAKSASTHEHGDVCFDEAPACDGHDVVADPLPAADLQRPTVWAVHQNSMFTEAPTTTERLAAGLYRPVSTNQGLFFAKVRCDTDNLITLPDTASERVLEEIQHFWTLKEKFTEYGLIHKRGVLMMGPPGSGKTATVHQLIAAIVSKYNGIAVFIDHPTVAANALQMLRRIEPNRPVVVLMEDFDALIARYNENEFLALLDGESQIDNIVFVATTNYPEKIDARFTDRPSRFDLVIEVPMPSASAREIYLRHKLPTMSDDAIATWVERSDGFSIAHLRELIVLVQVFGKPLREAVSRLEHMRTAKHSSQNMDDGKRTSLGFTAASGSHEVRW